jgi:hypothetical protein
MNCFDCASHGLQVPAVAVCVDCGAAVCLDHADIAPRWLTYTVPINRIVRVETPARSIRCGLCTGAHHAAPVMSAVG